MSFKPQYIITPQIAQALTRIELTRHKLLDVPITATLITSLRESAKLRSTHHSTAIEGNRLSMAEVEHVEKGRGHLPRRERDEKEVQRYYNALHFVEQRASDNGAIREHDIQLIHGQAFLGKDTPTPYRDDQNIIRNGKLVDYIPPRAEDVPSLMNDLCNWLQDSLKQPDTLVPVIAAIAHYQFATIHPYYDGNGRTARLLTTLILHQNGYDLKGIYSLEEYYTSNIESYYNSLAVGADEDYYDGQRADGDITKFIEYFVVGMAEAFDKVCALAQGQAGAGTDIKTDQAPLLRILLPQQRQILKLFTTSAEVTTKDIASFFGMNDRQARFLCKGWVERGFLEISNPAPKTRRYKLTDAYEGLVQQ